MNPTRGLKKVKSNSNKKNNNINNNNNNNNNNYNNNNNDKVIPRTALLAVKKPFSASKRVNSRRKNKAPRDAATAVGVRSGMTEP